MTLHRAHGSCAPPSSASRSLPSAATRRAPLRSACLALLAASCLAVHAGQPAAPASAPKTRTPAEVEALIAQAGASQPDWWNTVQLTFPPTLDLTWSKPPKGAPWTPNKYLSQYLWSTVNENPSKWNEGARLLHHVLTVNKDNPEPLKQTMQALGGLYRNLLQDYARAAYWWRKAGFEDDEELGHCYWMLGSKEMAVKALEHVGADESRHGSVIKLWSDIGEYEKAFNLAAKKATEDDNPDVAYLCAGDICRKTGRYVDAIAYYNKVLALAKGGRDLKQSKGRAQASLDAVKLYDALDLKRVADGVFSADSFGYSGQVYVNVTVKGGRIEKVEVPKHTEKQYYGSLTDTPRQIVAKQSVKNIDTYSSATITSEAIINATAKALKSGMK